VLTLFPPMQAVHELLTLLSRFANNTSTEAVLDAVRALYDDARRDETFRAWFGRVDAWGRRVGFASRFLFRARLTRAIRCFGAGIRAGAEVQQRRGRGARGRYMFFLRPIELLVLRAGNPCGRRFFDDKYQAHFDGLFDAVGAWCVAFWGCSSDADRGLFFFFCDDAHRFSSLAKDPLNERFGHDWARLTRDLLFDADGSSRGSPSFGRTYAGSLSPKSSTRRVSVVVTLCVVAIPPLSELCLRAYIRLFLWFSGLVCAHG